MTLRYPDLESVKKGITAEINGYIDGIRILCSLREYLQHEGIKSYIEKKIAKKEGGYKTPDLLIRSNGCLIADHKYTESKNHKTLASKVEEMEEYETAFEMDSSEFRPEVVMITPRRAIPYFKKILNCPTTWGYILDEEIILEQSIGSVSESRISSLFDHELYCPISDEVAKYKFILSHAPLPYTAYHVYMIMWNLRPAGLFFTLEFEVKYEDILTTFNNLFPPWISPEIRQLNDSRVQEALGFLHKIGWIRWLETEKKVIVYTSKGMYVADLFLYFVDNYIKIEHAKHVKEYEKKAKQLLAEEIEQKRLSEFF